ncbi:MAG TPA: LysR family transcriptional regulator [Usitatibacter sp.]|nr:LysR family transcriptional regulator [Usitatibacter sp.]
MIDELDLRDLRYFEAIADAGHVGRAARQQHRSQPAMTTAVRRLEAKLGTPLFERAGRGIRLTAAGAALHARARSLRIAAPEAVREVADVGSGRAGVVRIGMVPTAARYLMPPLCAHFLADSPDLAFKTVIANNDVLHAALKAGDIDLAVNIAATVDEEVAYHAIFRDECVVVARRAHAVFRKRATLRELAGYGWLLGSPALATRQWLEHVFLERRLPAPVVRIETSQVLLLPALIEQTDLLSFMSRRHLRAGGALREVPLRETTMRREFAVGYRKGSYLSPAAVRVLEELKLRAGRLFKA